MRALFLLLFLVSLAAPSLAQSVVDGDTLFVGRLKYRLCGIDAPERNEPSYRQATTYLRALIKGKTVKYLWNYR